MKKIVLILLVLFLLAPLALCGCINDNNNNNNTTVDEKYVEYKFITWKKEVFNSSSNVYVFQVKVENKTEESAYIIANQFNVLHYYTSEPANITNFGVYEEESLENEITMSKTIAPGQTKELYIRTGPISNIKAIDGGNFALSYISLKYNNSHMVSIYSPLDGAGGRITQNTVRI